MGSNSLLRTILDDEALTRGLGDAEARVLVEWLVDETERLVLIGPPDSVERAVARLRRRGRAVARFVRLWSIDDAFGSALQLAASERFPWPLPDAQQDPCELMQGIVYWETHAAENSSRAA